MDIRDLIKKMDDIDRVVVEGEFDQYSGDPETAQAAVKGKEEFVAKQKQLYTLLQKLRTLVNPVSESHNLIARPLVESFGYTYLTEQGERLSKFSPYVRNVLSKLGLLSFVAYEGYTKYNEIMDLYQSNDPDKIAKITKILTEAAVEYGAWRVGVAIATWVLGASAATPVLIVGTLTALASKLYMSKDKNDLIDEMFKLFTDADLSDTKPVTTSADTTSSDTTVPTATGTTPTDAATPSATPAFSGQGPKPSEPTTTISNPEVKSVVDQIKGLIADLQQSSDPDAPKAINHAKQTLQIYAPGL